MREAGRLMLRSTSSFDYIRPTCPEVDKIANQYAGQFEQLVLELASEIKEVGTIPLRDAFDQALREAESEINALLEENKDLMSENAALKQRVDALECEVMDLDEQIAKMREVAG